MHFDDQLKTNISNPKQPFVVDKNYAALSEADGAFWKYPVLRKSKGRDKDEKFDIDRYLAEFDVKDVLEVADTKHFQYDPQIENRLPFNIMNGFKADRSE